MISLLRYSLFPLIFFPLLYGALLSGGMLGWAYILGFSLFYLVIDNLLPSSSGAVKNALRGYFNLILVLHIPLSAFALLMLFWQLNPSSAFLSDFVTFFSQWLPWVEPRLAGGTIELVGLVAACGFMFGHNTAVAHEIMHRSERWLFEASRFLFAMCGDAQVVISHIHSHHANVATLADPTSARRGDSIYRHYLRAVIGQYRASWKFEMDRLQGSSLWLKATHNQVVNGLILTAIMLVSAYFIAGIVAVFCWLVIMLMAKALLEAINYVQHYGLVRVQGTKVQSRHSWETRSLGSRVGLYNATCHGAHHVNGNLPFWQIDNSNVSPQLPHGYMFAIGLSLIPPLWFRYIEPALAHWDEELATVEELNMLQFYPRAMKAKASGSGNINFS